MSTVGERINNLRLRHNMSISELSRKINVDRTSISKYENGHRMPSREVLTALSSEFNVSIDYLLGNETPDMIADEIIDMLIRKKIINQGEKLTDKKRKEIVTLLDKAIEKTNNIKEQ